MRQGPSGEGQEGAPLPLRPLQGGWGPPGSGEGGAGHGAPRSPLARGHRLGEAELAAHDHHFTHALGMVDRMREGGIENVTWLSEGVEPEFYAFDAISAAERTRYETDVLLIGNLHANSNYWPRQEMVAASLRAGFRTRWWGPRIAMKLRFIPLFLSPVARAYGGGMVFNDTWAKAVSCSKIFIARDVQPEVLASMSNRAYTAMGCGAFYLCYHTEGIEKVFEVGKELDTFRTLDEMVEKIRYYLDHEDQRRSIAEAGRKRVLENYTYADRFQEMFRVLEERGLWKPA